MKIGQKTSRLILQLIIWVGMFFLCLSSDAFIWDNRIFIETLQPSSKIPLEDDQEEIRVSKQHLMGFWRLSQMRSWADLSHDYDRALLEVLTRQSGIDPKLLEAYRSKLEGIGEFVRAVHPYTTYSLKAKGQFVLHFSTHEGVYYALWAEKILGRLPKEGIPIISFDSHSDYSQSDHSDISGINKGRVGVNDANWAYAVVRDGLSPWVLQISKFDASGVPYSLIIKRKRGEPLFLIEWHSPDLLIRFFLPYAKSFERTWCTVDLDFFSVAVHSSDRKTTLGHVKKREVRQFILDEIIHWLAQLDIRPSRLLTADSLDYLSFYAREKYREYVRKELKKIFLEFRALHEGNGVFEPPETSEMSLSL